VDFLISASAAALAGRRLRFACRTFASLPAARRVFVGSNTPDGILAFDWDPATGELTPAGVAAKLENVDWITFSPGREYLLRRFGGGQLQRQADRRCGQLRVANGELQPLSAQNSASNGTCHVALDRTGRVLLGGRLRRRLAASFLVTDGQAQPCGVDRALHRPRAEQGSAAERARALCFVLARQPLCVYQRPGRDCIHIYRLERGDGNADAGREAIKAKPGAGPRTLHFHPNGHTAYSINELDSTVDVLEWSKADGSLDAGDAH
jgi:6-phosphogluconolactonase